MNLMPRLLASAALGRRPRAARHGAKWTTRSRSASSTSAAPGRLTAGPTRHDRARLAVEEHFGGRRSRTATSRTCRKGADSERSITADDSRRAPEHGPSPPRSVSAGRRTAGSGGSSPMSNFEHANRLPARRIPTSRPIKRRASNEGRAVLGHIAPGHMTESNIIGYMGPTPIPEVIQGINLCLPHAREVNPERRERVVWSLTPGSDPGRGATPLQALIDAGVDVLMQHPPSSTAPQTVAQEAGQHSSFGQASDMIQFRRPRRASPRSIDTGQLSYIRRVGGAMDVALGNRGDIWPTGIRPPRVVCDRPRVTENIPEEGARTRSRREMIDAIRRGRGVHTRSPARSTARTATAWLAEGETGRDGTLAGMDFYVEGHHRRTSRN